MLAWTGQQWAVAWLIVAAAGYLAWYGFRKITRRPGAGCCGEEGDGPRPRASKSPAENHSRIVPLDALADRARELKQRQHPDAPPPRST